MASIIRIKRRRTDDPAEALLFSQKKSRVEGVESVLEFAGTLASKDESVSSHIKEAIRKKKIHKQMHPHSSECKAIERSELTNKLRKQNKQKSHDNRYRITFSRRALDIDNLDCDDKNKSEKEQEAAALPIITQGQSENRVPCQQSGDNQEDSFSLSRDVKSKDSAHDLQKVSCSLGEAVESKKDSYVKSPRDKICGTEREKTFCLIDVEHDSGPDHVTETSASAITVNGMPMMKTKVPISEESDDYVYDLYYTHTRLSDIQNQDLVTVEALCNDLLHDERDDESEDFVYDDDDDSNDESNWRNDYPDEDPYFFENADKDYEYRNDMRESIFNGDEDEGNMLSYWMDTRCRIDVDCNDFDDDSRRDASSSDEEAGAELGYY